MNKKLLVTVILAAFASVTACSAAQYADYRAAIKDFLKDPTSAEFRSEKVSSSGVYCAEVNSKNSYGGYTGFDRVIANGKNYVIFERSGVQGSGPEHLLFLVDVEKEWVDSEIKALKRKNAGETIEIPSERESREIALPRVFEKWWSEKCL